MKKLIQGKELKVLLIALIVVGLGIVVYGISVIVIKNKSANQKSLSIIEYSIANTVLVFHCLKAGKDIPS